MHSSRDKGEQMMSVAARGRVYAINKNCCRTGIMWENKEEIVWFCVNANVLDLPGSGTVFQGQTGATRQLQKQSTHKYIDLVKCY